MNRILSFQNWLVEAIVWPTDISDVPEWELLQIMGFVYDRHNIRKTVCISHPEFGKFLLTKEGYVRVPDREGFLFQSKISDPLPRLMRYLIKKFFPLFKRKISELPTERLDLIFSSHPELLDVLDEIPQLKNEIMSRTGTRDEKADMAQKYGLSPKQIKWLDSCTTNGSWKIDPKTGLVDTENFKNKSSNKLGLRGIKFGKATGNFIIEDAGLTSLEGCPQSVSGNFECGNNELTTLQGGPKSVGGDYNCNRNKLENLFGAPEEIPGRFSCYSNNLTTLEGSPKKIGAYYLCNGNDLKSLKGCPEKIGGPFECDAFFVRNWNVNSLLDIFKGEGGRGFKQEKAKRLVAPLLSNDILDEYFSKNPLDLDLVDDYPEIKQGILDRTGIKDFSAAGRALRSGLF